jgi:TRAP-type C4-dicarboxylate transport system permease large subunit
MMMVLEMGLITPPIGMNVLVLGGVIDVPLVTIFCGVIPFMVTILICIVIMTIFTQIALFLPNLMR